MTLQEFMDAFNDKGLKPFCPNDTKIGDCSQTLTGEFFNGEPLVEMIMFSEIGNIFTKDYRSIVGDSMTIGEGIPSSDPFQTLYNQIMENNPIQFGRLPCPKGGVIGAKCYENDYISVRVIYGDNILNNPYALKTDPIELWSRIDVIYAKEK